MSNPRKQWADKACWLHPAIEVRASPISGTGLFAARPLAAGTVVSRLGGLVVSSAELAEMFTRAERDGTYVDTVTIGDGLNLVLPPDTPNGKGNHSCDPNLWWTGDRTLTVRRDIAEGEELTNNYTTSSDAAGFVMDCACGSVRCRGRVTGDDWRRSDLRERYGDHWLPWLLQRIRTD